MYLVYTLNELIGVEELYIQGKIISGVLEPALPGRR